MENTVETNNNILLLNTGRYKQLHYPPQMLPYIACFETKCAITELHGNLRGRP